MLIDHDANEKKQFKTWNRFKYSEAVQSWKWRLVHLISACFFVWMSIHFQWDIPPLGVVFIGSMVSIYVASVIISAREALKGRWKQR